MLIDGLRETSRAADSGVEITEIYHRQTEQLSATVADWIDHAKSRFGDSVQWLEVAAEVFERMAYGDRDDGIIAVARQPSLELADVRIDVTNGLVVIAERLEKPGNLGAILRTADATAVDALLLVDPQVDVTNPNVIRAAMGASFTVPVVRTTAELAKSWCHAHGLQIVTTRVDSTVLYHEVDLKRPIAIVLGSEADGLTDHWCGDDVTPVRLPMKGITDSLNVSVTAAVLLYEAERQRGLPPGN